MTDVIDELEKLDKNKQDDEVKKENNRTICRMIKLHLPEFFDDIYVPFGFFKDDEWRINKVLYANEDALFYNEKYLATEDNNRFYEIFDRYVEMIEEIMSTDNKLFVFLKVWTNTDSSRWKCNNSSENSYLKSIITDNQYQIISPLYMTNCYCQLNKDHHGSNDVIKDKFIEHLNEICEKFKSARREFKEIYSYIVESYVYDYPIYASRSEIDTYKLGFINSILMAILDFAEKLLDLNIYCIHAIIGEIIYYYTPLDEINRFDPKEYGGRKLLIV